MASTTQALDGAIASILIRIVDAFARELGDEDRLRTRLGLRGVEGADADTIVQFVSGRAAKVSRLKTDLPGLLEEFASSSPDLTSVARPAADLWKVVASLADAAPAIPRWQVPFRRGGRVP